MRNVLKDNKVLISEILFVVWELVKTRQIFAIFGESSFSGSEKLVLCGRPLRFVESAGCV